MTDRLIVVGKNIYTNGPLMDYIYRELESSVNIKAIYKIEETDTEILSLLQRQLALKGNLTIVTNKNSFALISKILSTATSDTLMLKENMLIPSKSVLYDDNTYLVEYNGCFVNVLQAEPGKVLPIFLIEERSEEKKLHIFGYEEKEIKKTLWNVAEKHDVTFEVTTLTEEWVTVHLEAGKYGETTRFLRSVMENFEKAIATNDVFSYIIKKFTEAKKTVTFAESCTGGLVAEQLTAKPGASNIFKGSLVTYANSIKASWLGVEKEILERYGAVSEQCVEQMLTGAMEIAKADYSLAVSGIAGPGGGTPQKPVGTVYVGAKSSKRVMVKRMFFEGDRNYIQAQSMLFAYRLLFEIAEEDLF